MRVVVLGATGLLGSGITRVLASRGHTVCAVARGNRQVVLPEGVQFTPTDRRDRAAMEHLVKSFRPDAVVDCVAYTRADGIIDRDVFAGKVAHLIMVSTDFVYKPSFQVLPITEDAPVRAGTAYSEGKVDCEEVLLRARELQVTVIRPPHIMGPGGKLGSGSIQGRDSSLIDRVRKGVPVVLIDAGIHLLQPLHVDDAGDAVNAILCNTACFGKVYNVCGPVAGLTRRYYEVIAETLGVPLQILSIAGDIWVAARPDQVSFARHRVYSLERIHRDTGWFPAITMETSVRRTVADILARGEDVPYVPSQAEERLLAALSRHSTEIGGILASLG
ncbi:MAG TPA: NAD-dependent epimerase/dehydratase family protein [Candidatus Latescibacteria bacterium]|nr:NAD-dependent epimerase/dehydratase family protein [Candidatus Latescibacterota bacterium]HOS63889.1 NAD-dependent epimerase/dehydratase family protein [Candidatus Latescibacterota bacterium]HPK73822.1 NAD-dependent epimerase/dehydratase family protein [Candidatus Latescibacterota bacterium]